MSSHHIIRDFQEPAILIMNAKDIPFHILEELLQWEPFVCIHEKSLSFAIENHLRWDALWLTTRIEAPETPFPYTLWVSNNIEEIYQKLLKSQQPTLRVVDVDYSPSNAKFPPENISFWTGKGYWSIYKNTYEKWLPEGKLLIIKPLSNVVIWDNKEINSETKEIINEYKLHRMVSESSFCIFESY